MRGTGSNQRLMRQQRDLTQPKGMPGRPWFKHMIYAPGLYAGYAMQYLSALEDSLAAGDWPKVRTYAALLHKSLATATDTARAAVYSEQYTKTKPGSPQNTVSHPVPSHVTGDGSWIYPDIPNMSGSDGI
jgi:hypothetical protein